MMNMWCQRPFPFGSLVIPYTWDSAGSYLLNKHSYSLNGGGGERVTTRGGGMEYRLQWQKDVVMGRWKRQVSRTKVILVSLTLIALFPFFPSWAVKYFSVVPSLPLHTVLLQSREKSSMNIRANEVPETWENLLNYGPFIKWVLSFQRSHLEVYALSSKILILFNIQNIIQLPP